ncbi:MAG: hypothetical protein PW788_06480 [Micavibrio sp.]|nr:hypothetical protein [Micavibrio sp.]
MKKLVFCVFFVCAFLLVAPAGAFETPVTDPQGKALLKKTGEDLKKYADMFNCKQFAFGNISGGGTILTLQFIPEGMDDPNQWTRMLSMTIYGLTGVREDDAKLVRKIIAGFESQYSSTAQVTADENYLRDRDLSMFLEYTADATKATPTQVTSVFMRVSDKTYAFIQLNARINELTPKESLTMRRLVNPSAK